MKLQKIMAGLLTGVLATAAMATIVSADFSLPTDAPWKGGNAANQWGWGTETMDSEAVAGLTVDILTGSKYLVIETKNPVDTAQENFQMVWQGSDVDEGGWPWIQKDVPLSDALLGDNLICFDLASAIDRYSDFQAESEKVKILVAYWGDGGWDTLGISKVYLTDTKPSATATVTVETPTTRPAATGGDGKEADTGAEGVAVLFGVAIIAAGAVVMSKKRK